MVNVRIDNQPITFNGQTAAFNRGTTYTERVIISPDTREITTPNPDPLNTFYANNATGALPLTNVPFEGKVQYIPVGKSTNPQAYILKHI